MEDKKITILSPMQDVVFKRLADEGYLDDLFVVACDHQGLVLEPPFTKLSGELVASTPKGRKIILDVLLQDQLDVVLNVEMQCNRNKGLLIRWGFHLMKLASELQLVEGEPFDLSRFVGQLAILNFDLTDVPPISSYRLRWDHGSREAIDSRSTGIVFQLPSAARSATLDYRLREWALFFTQAHKERVMAELTHPPVLTARRRLLDLSKDELMQKIVNVNSIKEIDRITDLAYAKKEGREQGLQETARNMLAQGFSVEMVSSITGFDLERVCAISQSIQP